MLRSCCLCLVGVIVVSFSAANLLAQDNGSGLIFTGCPPYLEGNHCDSMFYQVVAIDVGTGQASPEAKYFIVSGPGEINERTGLWLFHPGREDLPPYYREELEIAAYKGNDTTTSDDNCFFDVRVYDKFPRFEGYCGAHLNVLPGDTMIVPLEVTDVDWCHDPEVVSVEISPEPVGFLEFDATDWTVTFIPDDADEGQTFEVVTEVVSGPMNISCRIFFDTFVQEPIKLRLASVPLQDVQPGDTVSVDIVVDAMPVDIDGMNLVIRYEDERLSFLQIEPGVDFFSPDSGCGWASIHPGWDYHCNIYPSRLIGLSIQATDLRRSSVPNCYRPDHFPAILASVKFVVTEGSVAGAYFAPFDFYWCDCASNQLFSPKHEHQYSPRAVYSPDGSLIEPSWLPGPSGVLDWCFLNSFSNVERTRQVEFRNGGIHLNLPEPTPQYSLRLGIRHDQLLGHFCDVPIVLETIDNTQGLGGFDFLIGYDASALAFQQAFEGDLYDSCGWEYFNYRYGGYSECGDACPSGMLRVIGMAETNNGSGHPGCDDPFPGYVQREQLPTVLAYLRFLVSNNRNLAGTFVPVGFFWYDCSDNILSNHDGREAYLSARVFDENDTIISVEAEFPTWFGAPPECIDSIPKPARRFVDFHAGGIEMMGYPPIDVRGDINLNGISYEIADAVMFSNYFIVGLAAFGSHVEGSIAASDCNADGIALSVADFVYLIRVVIGDAAPCLDAAPSPNTARFTQDPNGVISVSTPDSLGAVHLTVEGEVTPTLLADHMEMMFGWDTGWTRILVYSYLANEFLSSGALVDVSGATGIVEVSTATFTGCPVESVIDAPLEPAPYSVRIGYMEDQIQGQLATIPITLESMSDDRGLGGFDILIGYIASALSFQYATEGDILNDCGWEYFTYRVGPNIPCEGDCPSGLVRIVGVAETNNGPIYAGCDSPAPGYVQPDQLPATLVNLHFLVSNDRNLECQFVGIRFFWTDCGDNVLTNYDGSEVFISSIVDDHRAGPIQGPDDFPTYLGAQDTCIFDNQPTGRSAQRWVDFYNGGVDMACPNPIDWRGDINLNAISWEIADAVMFANYFVQGLSAFGSHVEGSIAASDCNADGIALSVADYVFLVRKVLGDAEPDPRTTPSLNPAYFSFDQSSREVVVTTVDELGAVRLVVQGEITPTLLAGQMEMVYGWDSGLTRILIYSPWEPNHYISGGPLVSLIGSSGIVEVETATFTGRPVESVIDTPLEPAPYSVRIGYMEDLILGQEAIIPITLEKMSNDRGLGGFDILVGYDASALSFLYATEGDILNDCGWEYFTYRYGASDPCEGGCPAGRIHIVGVAEINNGATYAGCDSPAPGYVQPDQLPATLFDLHFRVSNDRNLECQFVPIRFFWGDCGDNVLTNYDGSELFISSIVDDYYYGPIQGGDDFPTYLGAQDSCILDNQPTGMSAMRRVDYYNGGLHIICADTIHARGDINLNGIPYEIRDAVMFSNYFIQGLSAFHNHVLGSTAASDVNSDGFPLSMADLIFLIRIIIGEADPDDLPTPSPNKAILSWNASNGVVSFESIDSIEMVFLVVQGEATIVPLDDQLSIASGDFGDGLTRILIESHANLITSGVFLEMTGAEAIVEAHAVTVMERHVEVVINKVTGVDDGFGRLPAQYALYQNYPNPFNPTTIIEYDLSQSSTVRLEIYNITGQKVRTLVSGQLAAGRQSVEWDGRDASGRRVSTGVYLYRLSVGAFVQTRKMLLLK